MCLSWFSSCDMYICDNVGFNLKCLLHVTSSLMHQNIFYSENILVWFFRITYPSRTETSAKDIIRGISSALGIAVDSLHDHLYWISDGIYRSNLNGSEITLIRKHNWLRDLDLDIANGYVTEKKWIPMQLNQWTFSKLNIQHISGHVITYGISCMK